MRNITVNETQYQVKDAAEAGIVAGMVLDEAAAKQLFQVRVENIGNLVRKPVKEMAAAGKSADEIQAYITERDNAYSFAVRGEGGGRRAVDPLERECRLLAIDAIKDKLAAQNRKYSDVKKENPEGLEAKIEQFAEHPDIVKLAKKRLAEKRKAGADDLALDL